MIRKDAVYRHREKGSLYLVLAPNGRLQWGDSWETCVIYREVNQQGSFVSDDFYVRLTAKFEERFEFVQGWSEMVGVVSPESGE